MDRYLVPLGHHFLPTDEEIKYLLETKLRNQTIPFTPILEFNIYNTEPWNLPAPPTLTSGLFNTNSTTTKGVHYKYFFVRRRKGRIVPKKGYWKASSGEKDQMGGVEGLMKNTLVYFSYKPGANEQQRSSKDGTKTKWIMHEYSLSIPRNHRKASKISQWTLCKIGESGRTSATNVVGQRRVSSIATTTTDAAAAAANYHLPAVAGTTDAANYYLPDPTLTVPAFTLQNDYHQADINNVAPCTSLIDPQTQLAADDEELLSMNLDELYEILNSNTHPDEASNNVLLEVPDRATNIMMNDCGVVNIDHPHQPQHHQQQPPLMTHSNSQAIPSSPESVELEEWWSPFLLNNMRGREEGNW